MFLVEKFGAYKRSRQLQGHREAGQSTAQRQHDEGQRDLVVKVTDKELCKLQRKIDKLLHNINNSKNKTASSQLLREEECVVCMNDRACMRTLPCNHVILCRACFVRTIQSAVSQRHLPLTCVLCRQRVLKVAKVSASTTATTTATTTAATPASTAGSNKSKKPRQDAYKRINSDTKYGVSRSTKMTSLSSRRSPASSFRKPRKHLYRKLSPGGGRQPVGASRRRPSKPEDLPPTLEQHLARRKDESTDRNPDPTIASDQSGASSTHAAGCLTHDGDDSVGGNNLYLDSPSSPIGSVHVESEESSQTDDTESLVQGGVDGKLGRGDIGSIRTAQTREENFKLSFKHRLKAALYSIPRKFKRNQFRYEIF